MDGESGLIGGSDGKYTVVARRYRPKSFTELVGQETVAQALSTAIRTCRVGHAYLFTGARGVGKTSTARIFAKALNAPGGPNPDPDLDSDVAQAIDSGEDMDVIEIDGASNRGIEEIRQLRANVNVRPSRSRYKIYIIDEVHMLTTPAFNALLKTLEEPPEHVKFIFCTTDPEKIPITVLSRCQRFDFSPVKPDKILERLKFICKNEHAEVEEEALRVIARRAAGSMRDSQSLLEQILSFSAGKITVAQVHDVLGTADETLLSETCRLLMQRDGAAVLRKMEESIATGVDAGQFGEQLLGYLRDLMVVAVGGSSDLLTTANPNSAAELAELGKTWGVSTLLSALQLLDEALVKMRHSIQGRILLEVALIQICQLQDLQKLADLIQYLQGNPDVAMARPSAPSPRIDATAHPSDEKKKDSSLATSKTESASNYGLEEPFPTPSSLISEAKGSHENSSTGNDASPSGTSNDINAGTLSLSPEGDHSTLASQSTESPESSDTDRSDTDRSGTDQVVHERSDSDESRSKQVASQTDVAQAVGSPEGLEENGGNLGPREMTAQGIWERALEKMDGFVGDYARTALRLETNDPKAWKVVFPMGSELALEFLENAESRRQMVDAIQSVVGHSVTMILVHSKEAASTTTQAVQAAKAPSSSQRMRDAAEHPFIQKICKEFGGEIIRVDPPPTPSQSAVPAPHRKTLEAVASGSKK